MKKKIPIEPSQWAVDIAEKIGPQFVDEDGSEYCQFHGRFDCKECWGMLDAIEASLEKVFEEGRRKGIEEAISVVEKHNLNCNEMLCHLSIQEGLGALIGDGK